MSDLQEILADKEKLGELTKEVFDEVDTDHSGLIDKNELTEALNKVARDADLPLPSQSDVNGVLKALDQDGSGTISLEEFKVLIYEILVALSSQ
jgi:Ca2+-binding EF-hand superfamily protein